jgi:transcriptional regulator PpsR
MRIEAAGQGIMGKSTAVHDGGIRFKSPEKTIGDLDAAAAANVIAAAADIAFIIDGDGVVRDLALSEKDLVTNPQDTWLGQPWLETVTKESQPKVREMLAAAADKAAPRWRQVNHPTAEGGSVPVRYAAVPLGKKGHIIAIGRDMRMMSSLQQRLIHAQQTMEQEYARLRHTETRYRLLFQMSSEPVMIVNAANSRVNEANPASARLLDREVDRIVGVNFPQMFDSASQKSIQLLFAALSASGHADSVKVRTADTGVAFTLGASVFRQDRATLFLVRLSLADGAEGRTAAGKEATSLLSIVENAPEGFVVTTTDGKILTANNAFLELAQLAVPEQIRDESLDRWLGRPGVEFNALVHNLVENGTIRLFETIVRGQYGSTTDVELSGVAVTSGETPCLGFVIRNVTGRPSEMESPEHPMARSVEKLTKLVGRVPLKDLVRESTDMIEKLCIEAALELTNDNRASAAELLGLSRQSLYAKLHRYGLVDSGDSSPGNS